MLRMHTEMNLILMMAAEKSQEKSTKSKWHIYIICPCNSLLLFKTNRSPNLYNIREIHIQIIIVLKVFYQK